MMIVDSATRVGISKGIVAALRRDVAASVLTTEFLTVIVIVINVCENDQRPLLIRNQCLWTCQLTQDSPHPARIRRAFL